MVNDSDARDELVSRSIRKAEEDLILLEKIVDDEDGTVPFPSYY